MTFYISPLKRIILLLVALIFLFSVVIIATASRAPGTATIQHYTVGGDAENAYQKGIVSDHWPTVADIDYGGYLNVQAGPTSNDVWNSGFRFENVQLAPGQHVTSATLRVWNNFGYLIEATVKAQAGGLDYEADPDLFASDRTYLGSVAWNVAHSPWGVVITLPDLTSLINAAVDSPGWVQGNSIEIVAFGMLDTSLPNGRGIDPGSYLANHPATLDLGL